MWPWPTTAALEHEKKISLRSAHYDRGVMHRAAIMSAGSRRARFNRRGTAFPIRSPPQQAWVAMAVAAGRLETSRLVRIAPELITPVRAGAATSNSAVPIRSVAASLNARTRF